MITDSELVKILNLPRASPSFAYRQQTDGSLTVVHLERITDDGAIYWIAGTSTLSLGLTVPSVFIIENGGANLLSVFWFIADCWYRSDDLDAINALELTKDQVFPFDWTYAIPVTNDSYHG